RHFELSGTDHFKGLASCFEHLLAVLAWIEFLQILGEQSNFAGVGCGLQNRGQGIDSLRATNLGKGAQQSCSSRTKAQQIAGGWPKTVFPVLCQKFLDRRRSGGALANQFL